jgi:hypothetical protein
MLSTVLLEKGLFKEEVYRQYRRFSPKESLKLMRDAFYNVPVFNFTRAFIAGP